VKDLPLKAVHQNLDVMVDAGGRDKVAAMTRIGPAAGQQR
jgi:hypothetical protein